jgi:hypothetical protein
MGGTVMVGKGLLGAILAVVVAVGSARAGQLSPDPMPYEGTAADSVLTVRDGGPARTLSLAEIEALPHMSYTLVGAGPGGVPGVYGGVRLVDLLDMLGLMDAEHVNLIAMDDYLTIIEPKKDEGLDQVLFATRLNGAPIPIETLGPFRLIWAKDADLLPSGQASSVKWIWNIAEVRKVD